MRRRKEEGDHTSAEIKLQAFVIFSMTNVYIVGTKLALVQVRKSATFSFCTVFVQVV